MNIVLPVKEIKKLIFSMFSLIFSEKEIKYWICDQNTSVYLRV